ncbi:RNA polymerase sigma factor [Lentzea sp. NPDC060358]|uniref:RNA polymerase sigma factor n=1 Tax=Lentzea sp. NPDC060358 TaxID=3347103 RepID=UPI00366085CC
MGTPGPDTRVDAELAHAAQAGDVSALGTLLTRHRPALLAIAVAMLGPGPDADDAVQETCLVALRRIGDLRDHAAAGSWLRAVARNVCRMRYRSPVHAPLGTGLAEVLPSAEPDPAQVLGQVATRDWLWHAMEELSPPLRLVLVLRHFSGVTAYEDIAEACGVPVGTVRSRLHEARGKLTRALLATADDAHGDVGRLTAERRGHVQDLLHALRHGDLTATLATAWLPTVALSGPRGMRDEGYDLLVRGLEKDLADGVGHHLTTVVASSDLTVCEFDLASPPDDPLHCPPGVAWVLHLRSGWVERARLVHARRPVPEPAPMA